VVETGLQLPGEHELCSGTLSEDGKEKEKVRERERERERERKKSQYYVSTIKTSQIAN
jgi:hypothetical protein